MRSFARRQSAAGVDGLIVPDMPPDEAGPLKGPADAAGLPLIFLLAPTSTPSSAQAGGGRVAWVCLLRLVDGYYRGEVEQRGEHPGECQKTPESLRIAPVAVGFGVATPEDAARVSKDGGWGDRRQRHRETDCVPPTGSQDGQPCRRVCPIVESRNGAYLGNFQG